MAMCEKCWEDAYLRMIGNGKSQADNYMDILEERKDSPCSLQEQAGQFWSEEYQCDKRFNDWPVQHDREEEDNQ